MEVSKEKGFVVMGRTNNLKGGFRQKRDNWRKFNISITLKGG